MCQKMKPKLFFSRNALQCHSSVGHCLKATVKQDLTMLWFANPTSLTLTTVIDPVPLCSSTCTVDRLHVVFKEASVIWVG